MGKYHGKDNNAKCKEAMGEKSIKTAEDPRITLSISSLTDLSSSQEDNLVGHSLSKKRQKLHWGYDLSKCLLLLEQTIGFNAIANLTVWYHKCGILVGYVSFLLLFDFVYFMFLLIVPIDQL